MLVRSVTGGRIIKDGRYNPLPDGGEVDIHCRGDSKRIGDDEHAIVAAVAQADRPGWGTGFVLVFPSFRNDERKLANGLHLSGNNGGRDTGEKKQNTHNS